MCINAPEGCQRGTHTNGTAYPLPPHEVLTQVHTHKHKPHGLRGSRPGPRHNTRMRPSLLITYYYYTRSKQLQHTQVRQACGTALLA
jgi:hypothetical protein